MDIQLATSNVVRPLLHQKVKPKSQSLESQRVQLIILVIYIQVIGFVICDILCFGVWAYHTGLSDWMYILRMYTLSHTSIVYKAITYRAYPDHRIRITLQYYIIYIGALVILGFEDLRPLLYQVILYRVYTLGNGIRQQDLYIRQSYQQYIGMPTQCPFKAIYSPISQ